MRDCTGMEICEEWLYHLGVPEDQIEDLAKNSANTIPAMMPFASAYFQPREAGDRPDVIPKGSVNFAFIGNFTETPRDTVFNTEYSIRTAMEAVYTLLNVDRGVPKVWGSVYDVLDLLDSAFALRDGKKLTYGTWFQGKDCVESIVEKNRGNKYSKAAKRASSDLTMLF